MDGTRNRRTPASRVVVWLATGAALGFLALYFGVALARLRHPFALELMEEALAATSVHLQQGGALYAEPTLEWVPLIYPPVFPTVGAGMFAVFGEHLWCLRLVSLLASAYVIAALWASGMELGGAAVGTLAAGFFAATYAASGGWFDLARIDTLFLALTLASFRWRGKGRWPWAAALFGVLAVYTKQTALPLCLALGAGIALADRRRGLAYLGTLLGGVLVAGAALHALSDGWSTFYLLTLPGSHVWEWERLPAVLLHDLALQLCGFLVVAAIGAAALAAGGGWRRHAPLLLLAGAAVVMAILARVRSGGWINVLMPLHALVALLAAFGLVVGNRVLRGTRLPVLTARVTLLGLVAVQLLLLAVASGPDGAVLRHVRFLPSAQARANGAQLLEVMRATRGPFLAPSHPFLAWQAKQPLQAEGTAAWDVGRGGDPELGQRLQEELRARLAAGHWRALLLDERNRGIPAPLYPREVAAFPPGEHMHTMRPEGAFDFDFERLWWRVRLDDAELLQRIGARGK